MKSVLLSTVVSIQADIVANWLTLKDVARLDSATCSETLRPAFLQIFRDPGCICTDRYFDQVHLSVFLNWVRMRSAKLATLSISAEPHTHIALPLDTIGRNLKEVHLRYLFDADLERVLSQVALLCPNLLELHMAGSILRGVVSLETALKNCKSLKLLNLSMSRHVTPETVQCIARYGTNLETLNLSGCDFLGSLAGVTFPENTRLTSLIVAYQDVETRNYLRPFVLQCTALRVLCLEEMDMADMFTIVERNPHLSVLSFSVHAENDVQNEINPDWYPVMEDELFTFLPLVKNLCALHVWNRECGSAVDPELITYIVLTLPRARMLAFSETTNLSKLLACTPHTLPPPVGEDSEETPLLEYLQCSCMDMYELPDLVHEAPALTHLAITDCALSWGSPCDEAFRAIAASKIHTLELYECRCVLDSDIAMLHDMQSIALHDYSKVTDAGILAFAAANPNLKTLRLQRCDLKAVDTLVQLVTTCTNLEYLQVERPADPVVDRNEFDIQDDTGTEPTNHDKFLMRQAKGSSSQLETRSHSLVTLGMPNLVRAVGFYG